jgi:selenocysteine lyase/cysteine desulfurase
MIPGVTYLNWAGLAPLTLRSYLRSLFTPELMGNMFLPGWIKRVEALRESVALWLGCEPDQVAFVPSTSMALAIAAHSLNWQSGDIVLYPDGDFPANVLPWHSLERFGVQPQGIQDWTLPWSESVQMVSISTVDFTTGIEQPWQQVVRQAHAAKIWSCVDAIQSAGVKPSWCPEIDFWCAGTQKWLASGLGLALLVLSRRVLNQLSPPFPTWLGLNQPPLIQSGISKTARGWELSWASPQALARFETNLKTFHALGWESITQGVRQRRDYLHERLLEMGWRVVSCPERWSGLVSFEPGAGQAEAIVQDGYRRRIITAQRGNYVRLSPHIFNSMKSLTKTVSWLWHCKVNSPFY